MESPYHTET